MDETTVDETGDTTEVRILRSKLFLLDKHLPGREVYRLLCSAVLESVVISPLKKQTKTLCLVLGFGCEELKKSTSRWQKKNDKFFNCMWMPSTPASASHWFVFRQPCHFPIFRKQAHGEISIKTQNYRPCLITFFYYGCYRNF